MIEPDASALAGRLGAELGLTTRTAHLYRGDDGWAVLVDICERDGALPAVVVATAADAYHAQPVRPVCVGTVGVVVPGPVQPAAAVAPRGDAGGVGLTAVQRTGTLYLADERHPMDTADHNTMVELLTGLHEASGYQVIPSAMTGQMEPDRKYLVVYGEDQRWLYLETHEPRTDPAGVPTPGMRPHHRTHRSTATCKIRTGTRARAKGDLTRDELHQRAKAFVAHVAAGGTRYPVGPAEMLLADAGVPGYAGMTVPSRRQPIMGFAEIREALGITRQSLTRLLERPAEQFPAPWVTLRCGPVWRTEHVEAWIAAHRPEQAPLAARHTTAGPDGFCLGCQEMPAWCTCHPTTEEATTDA